MLEGSGASADWVNKEGYIERIVQAGGIMDPVSWVQGRHGYHTVPAVDSGEYKIKIQADREGKRWFVNTVNTGNLEHLRLAATWAEWAQFQGATRTERAMLRARHQRLGRWEDIDRFPERARQVSLGRWVWNRT